MRSSVGSVGGDTAADGGPPPPPPPRGRTIELQSFDTIEAELTEWLWEGRIPRGMLTRLVGTEGLGKSAATLAIAAALTRGALPGTFEGTPTDAALITVEDDPRRTIWPRLVAAGADLERVHTVKVAEDGQGAGFVLPRDAADLGRKLGDAGVSLVIIDPLSAALDPKLNSHKDTDVREAMGPLGAAAEEHDFAMLGVMHTNKAATTDARQRAIGSAGWRYIVRSELYLGVDPDDPGGKEGQGRAIAHSKCNVGRMARTVRVKLSEATATVKGRPQKYVRADFGEECDHTANELLAAEAGVEREGPTKQTAAMGLIHEMLADGPKAVAALKQAAEDREISWRTLERAKETAGVKAKQVPGGWVWALPGDRLEP
ncbi:MAG: AAA family ATPase [Thermoleophilaceae bacterium]